MMRGIYINACADELETTSTLSHVYSRRIEFAEHDITVIYNHEEWPSEPLIQDQNTTLVVSGWFIFNGKKNDLKGLFEALKESKESALQKIEAGSFVAVMLNDSNIELFNDPFGLSTHYIDKNASTLRIAPAVKVLINSSAKINPILAEVLALKGHLFGNFTLYDGVERLSPATYLQSGKVTQYVDLSQKTTLTHENIAERFKWLQSLWQKNEKLLPLSSGMDSRFILATGEFAHGFTYGPDNSPEREITAQYSDCFEDYLGYDFGSVNALVSEHALTQEMAFGVLKPIPNLLNNYAYVKKHFHHAFAFFDGYLGDVLQRATYINYKGLVGEILKLFPWVYTFKSFTEQELILGRYKGFSSPAQTLLLSDFADKTAHLSLDAYQKVTYYEFLYGRGGRYTVFGSNVLAAQLFTVVSPFASRSVFSTFINQNFAKAVRYGYLQEIWGSLPEKFKLRKVESGYTPMTIPAVIPPIQLWYRVLFHVLPSRANYGVKLKRENHG